jgi:hypothetical protein
MDAIAREVEGQEALEHPGVKPSDLENARKLRARAQRLADGLRKSGWILAEPGECFTFTASVGGVEQLVEVAGTVSDVIDALEMYGYQVSRYTPRSERKARR